MGKITGPDYQAMLDQAGDEADREVSDQQLQDLIDQRLNALGAGLEDLGEAGQAAATADSPRLRVNQG